MLPDLPKILNEAVATTDGRYLYVSGGYSGTYSTNIYRLDLTDKSAGWLAWKSLSTGVQRHSMEYANGTLFIIGGRDATTYRNIITSIDTTTKEETMFATFAQPRGWHKSCVYNGHIYLYFWWLHL